MNKLVIVGNGFDLAHGLPTSYKHFIDDFWGNLFLNYKKDEIKELVFLDDGFETFQIESEINSFADFSNHGTRYIQWFKDNYQKHRFFNSKNHNGKNDVFYFKNDFFELINSKNSIENWVDIENEYYQELKEISKQKAIKSTYRITATKKQQEEIVDENGNNTATAEPQQEGQTAEKAEEKAELTPEEEIIELKQKHREWSALNEVHAEINMILSTDRKDYQGGSLYVTHKPCSRCAPVLAASGLKSVYYSIDGLTNDSDCSIFGSVELIKL